MRSFRSTALAVALAAAALPAQAYTPESGTWWNPNEPGTGIFIEVQDNFLVAAAYVYDPLGNASWYTATGFLTGNARFVGQLDAFRNGQCVGCVWRPNTELLGAGGPISIDFDPDDPTRARLSWGGRSNIPIERFQFYLQRPEDVQAGRPQQLTKMLGEWQMVLDFSSIANSFPYYGELLVFDNIDLSASTDYVEGCRAQDSLVGFCSDAAFRDHEAAGFYDAQTREHVIVVEDSVENFAMYVLRVGTNHVQGEVSVYRRGSSPSTFYPVRGFRSASRTFVDEGIGPSKAKSDSDTTRPGIADLVDFNATKAGAGVALTSKIAPDRLANIVSGLEAKLQQR